MIMYCYLIISHYLHDLQHLVLSHIDFVDQLIASSPRGTQKALQRHSQASI